MHIKRCCRILSSLRWGNWSLNWDGRFAAKPFKLGKKMPQESGVYSKSPEPEEVELEKRNNPSFWLGLAEGGRIIVEIGATELETFSTELRTKRNLGVRGWSGPSSEDAAAQRGAVYDKFGMHVGRNEDSMHGVRDYRRVNTGAS